MNDTICPLSKIASSSKRLQNAIMLNESRENVSLNAIVCNTSTNVSRISRVTDIFSAIVDRGMSGKGDSMVSERMGLDELKINGNESKEGVSPTTIQR